MAKKHIKRCSTSLPFKYQRNAIPTHNTTAFHILLGGYTKRDIQNAEDGMDKLEPSYIANKNEK